MSAGLARRETTDVARPLKVLVPLIKSEIEQGDEAGLEHYRRAGEMLLEAKEQVERGEWGRWVDRHFTLSHSQANRYMQLAERMLGETPRRRIDTMQSVVEPNRSARIVPPTWHEPVQKITNRVNVSALVADEKGREKERQLTRGLALQLIDIGYKVLVTKLHPDKGGSTEAMTRLNRVRDLLRRAI